MEFLDLTDDYEREAYELLEALQICEQGDCRDPRRGPFVEFNGQLICWPCFQEYELGLDPADSTEERHMGFSPLDSGGDDIGSRFE